LRLARGNRRRNTNICQQTRAHHIRILGTVARANRGLRGVEIDEILLNEPRVLGAQGPARTSGVGGRGGRDGRRRGAGATPLGAPRAWSSPAVRVGRPRFQEIKRTA
jgi:hypothetical protein